MNSVMNIRKLILSDRECGRLREVLHTAKEKGGADRNILKSLEKEIDRAMVLPPDEIPPYVVTMHTSVRIIDLNTQTSIDCTLVYPEEADSRTGKTSILSDIGVAIIGFSVGDTVEWDFPDGTHRLRIHMITYQPEATRNYTA